jgi:hypothetical protein
LSAPESEKKSAVRATRKVLPVKPDIAILLVTPQDVTERLVRLVEVEPNVDKHPRIPVTTHNLVQ